MKVNFCFYYWSNIKAAMLVIPGYLKCEREGFQ